MVIRRGLAASLLGTRTVGQAGVDLVDLPTSRGSDTR